MKVNTTSMGGMRWVGTAASVLHSTYRICDEDNTHGTKWESISDDPYDLVLLTQGEVLEG